MMWTTYFLWTTNHSLVHAPLTVQRLCYFLVMLTLDPNSHYILYEIIMLPHLVIDGVLTDIFSHENLLDYYFKYL